MVQAQTVPLKHKIGQLILVGFVGDSTDNGWFKSVEKQISDGEIGGVLYLQRNIASRPAVLAMNQALNAAAIDKPTLFIGIDQEGGAIQRLTPAVGFPSVPSASRVASKMNPRQAFETYSELASQLRKWGFNLNLGPVVDLNTNPANPIIGRLGRSFSEDPEKVVQYAVAFIDAHRTNGILTALKHYPGHGSSHADSHNGFVDVTNSWNERELEPFSELIQQGYADMVMTAHVRNRKLQEANEEVPASLSSSVIAHRLRKQRGFDGVVISDDLQMAAITNQFDIIEAAIMALRAGTDILVFANDKNPDLDLPPRLISAIARASESDERLLRRIDEAYDRVVSLKRIQSAEMPAGTDKIKARSIRPMRKGTLLCRSTQAAPPKQFLSAHRFDLTLHPQNQTVNVTEDIQIPDQAIFESKNRHADPPYMLSAWRDAEQLLAMIPVEPHFPTDIGAFLNHRENVGRIVVECRSHKIDIAGKSIMPDERGTKRTAK